MQALRCKNSQCPPKWFPLFDEQDFLLSVCLWLRLNSEYKIKHYLKQVRMNKNSSVWRLGSASLFTYQRWAHGVAGRPGVPPRYALTPSQMRNHTAAESKYSDPPCAHLHGCPWEACRLLSGHRLAKQLGETRYAGRGREKERKKASKTDIYHFQFLSHHAYLFPKENVLPVNDLGAGRFDLYSPWCHKHPFPHRTAHLAPICAIPF